MNPERLLSLAKRYAYHYFIVVEATSILECSKMIDNHLRYRYGRIHVSVIPEFGDASQLYHENMIVYLNDILDYRDLLDSVTPDCRVKIRRIKNSEDHLELVIRYAFKNYE